MQRIAIWYGTAFERLSQDWRLQLLFYLLVSFAFRWFAFGRSVIDWDETSYLLIGKALLDGKELYVDVWDTKPPAIFLIASAFAKFFADPVVAWRIAGAILIGLTGWMLHQAGNAISKGNNRVALAAGVFYIMLISFQSFGYSLGKGFGMEVNSEVYFLFFSMLGVWQFVAHPQSVGRIIVAGLSFGTGFLIKPFVAFDMLALGLIGLMWMRQQTSMLLAIRQVGLLAVACVLPFGIQVLLLLAGIGNFDAWYAVTFKSGAAYNSGIDLNSLLHFWGDFFFLTTFVTLTFAVVLLQTFRVKVWHKNPWIGWLLLWFGIVAIGITLPGKWHYHYWYQLFPAYALLAAHAFHPDLMPQKALRMRTANVLVTLVLISWPVITFIKIGSKFSKPDYPRLVAQYINQQNISDLRIHVDNYRHVMHFYTGTMPLSKYYHPSLLYVTDHVEMTGMDRIAELNHILEQKPHYIIYRDRPTSQHLRQQMAGTYAIDTVFNNNIYLAKRIE